MYNHWIERRASPTLDGAHVEAYQAAPTSGYNAVTDTALTFERERALPGGSVEIVYGVS